MDKNRKKFFIKVTTILLSVAILLGVFCYFQNNTIVVSEFECRNEKIPQSFDGTRILQISDLHNKEFGKDQKHLIKKIEKASPDYIVVTGDLIDRNHTNIDIAMNFIERAKNIAPVFYVNGNHEKSTAEYELLKIKLTRAGVEILENTNVILKKNGENIQLFGANDPNFLLATDTYDIEILFDRKIEEIMAEKQNNNFSILLSHRPEMFDIYEKNGVDFVFSGHAHGGQIRLPFVGGLIAPNQGFFPEYTSGMYKKNNTEMVVSRGLGRSIIPFRLFNRPEIVVVTLSKTS